MGMRIKYPEECSSALDYSLQAVDSDGQKGQL
jgi:hypothetical protein